MKELNEVSRTFKWEIKNIYWDALNKYNIDEEFIDEKEVTVIFDGSETVWEFRLEVDKTKVGIFLSKVKTPAVGTVKFKVYVFDRNARKHFKNSESESFWNLEEGCYEIGWPNFVRLTSVLNGNRYKFIDKNTLTIGLKLKLYKQTGDNRVSHVAPTNSFQEQLNVYATFFNSKEFSDFTIECSDGKEIPAHKMVLAAHSNVFKIMLDTPMSESQKQKVVINDIDSETMLEILRFIYIRKVEKIDELAPKILHGASKYMITKLQEVCASTMIKSLSTENVIEYFILAERYSIKTLMSKCLEFIYKNYQMIRQSEEWKKLNVQLIEKITDYFEMSTDRVECFESRL